MKAQEIIRTIEKEEIEKVGQEFNKKFQPSMSAIRSEQK